MRHIGSIANANEAETFSAYLTIQGVANQIELEENEYNVWVKDEDQLKNAIRLLEDYQKNPQDEKYKGVVEEARKRIDAEIEERKQAQKNIVNVRDRWPSGAKRRAPLTITLIVISCVVGLLTSFGYVPTDPSGAVDIKKTSAAMKALSFNYVEGEAARKIVNAKKSDDDIRLRFASLFRGEVWRAFTPIFIHFGAIHLLFNMIWMFILARLVEDRFGTPFFAIIVLLSALLPNLAGCAVPEAIDGHGPAYSNGNPAYIMGLLGGMSGVVYGVFGFAWIRGYLDPACGIRLAPSTIIIFIVWFFIGCTPLDEAWLNMSISNWGHGGGLVVGMAIAWISFQLDRAKFVNRSRKS